DRTEAHASAADPARRPLRHRRGADLARSLRSPRHADDSAPGLAGHAVLCGARDRRASRTMAGRTRADSRDGLVGVAAAEEHPDQLHAGAALLRAQAPGQLDAVGVVGRARRAALLLL